MKRILRIWGNIAILAALLLAGLPVLLVAAQDVAVTVYAPAEPALGSSFTARINITEVSQLNAAQYDIWFDPEILELIDINDGMINGTEFPINTENGTREFEAGHWRIVQSLGLTSVNGTGYLSELHFFTIGCNSSDINITDGVLSGMAGEIFATWTGTSVNVACEELEVITESATDITPISADLNGYLVSTGEYSPVYVSFEWGTESEVYTENTAPQQMTDTGPFSEVIDTLSPNTEYFYRAKATANGVTVYGGEVSFTTYPVGVDFRIEPSSQVVGIEQTFEVEIWVDASTQAADTVEAYLDFDTTYLKVVNASGDIIEGTANDVITPGIITTTKLTTKLKNQVDNNNGYADIAYGMPPGGTPADEDFLFGTVRFKALAETENTALSFHVGGLRTTTASLSFTDVTGARIGGDVTVTPNVQLRISVSLQGRPPAPNERYIIPVKVWLHEQGAPWTEAEGNGSLFYFETQTTEEGIIDLLVLPGTYDIRVKGRTTLKNLASNIDVYPPSPAEVNLGTLIEGDVNDDNMVTGLDYSAVIMCFGYAVDDPAAPGPTQNCDFNNDSFVTGLDYSAIIMNFGIGGADIE